VGICPRSGQSGDRVYGDGWLELQQREHGGTKLMEIRRLRAPGHRITIIGEQQFWKLAASRMRARRRKA